MIEAREIENAIRRVTDQTTFVRELLIDVLGWPIDKRATSIEDIAYEWSEKELRAAGLSEEVAGSRAFQIVLPGNPWGIFIFEFKNPDVFATGRGMTGVLRKVLQGLAFKKRGSRDPRLAAFNRDNLLFICNHKYESYRFAHFKAPDSDSVTPPMASFGWGPDDLAAVRTVCEFNLRALQWPDSEPSTDSDWIKAWAGAFDVEKVTTQFYRDYAAVFAQVENSIAEITVLSGDELRLYTQSLFNRLMFLRFIERKGWLTFPGQRGTQYLAALSSAGSIGRKSVFRARVQPLFFEGLVEEGKQRTDAYGSVPLLNGGLFERSDVDRKVADLPDRVFSPVIGPDGIFYRYNFTVQESTPLDIEVAVDPEMLGRVFEELVTGRHESGSYYTPRPVVAFMCREALKGHLATRTAVPEKAIERLVDDHFVEGLTEAHAQQVADALDSLRAVDPACGSGAYLLGLLHELIAIRRALQSERLLADPQFLYKLKLHIISKSLYGADIDRFATEIAKLRLWLSLAVEAEHPLPLPNLDFKIETGDSLLGPCDAVQSDMFHNILRKRAATLVALKDNFLVATGSVKAELKAAILREEDDIAAELMHGRGEANIIDWQVQFAEVFAKNGGFDIVLANPPYVSALEFLRTRKAAERIALRDRFETTKGAWDLYVPFFERGLQLLRTGGQLAYISPNKYLSATYAKALREYIRTTSCFWQLVDLTQFSIFRSVSVYPVLTFLQRGPGNSGKVRCRLPFVDGELDAEPSSFAILDVDQAALDLLPDHLWGFLLSDKLGDLTRLLADTVPMFRVAEVRATTTAAEADIFGGRLRNGDEVGAFHVLNTGTIDPYVAKWGTADLTHQGQRFRKPILRRKDVSPTRRELYAAPKILIAKMAKRCEAFLDYDGTHAGLNINCIARPRGPFSLEFLCGYCNSSVFMFFYNQLFGALRMSQGYYQFQAPQLKAIPVPKVSQEDHLRIAQMVQKVGVLASTNPLAPDVRTLTQEIDLAIGALFGLSATALQDLTSAPSRADEAATGFEGTGAVSAEVEEEVATRNHQGITRIDRKDRYVTCVPLIPLKAAAGAFSDPQHIDDDWGEWTLVKTSHRLRPGMFVAQVVGKSMEPAIPDGSWCLFRAPVEGARQGKTVLVRLRDATDPETGVRYTVKRYESEKTAKGDAWRHERITLKPNNPDFEPIVLTPKDDAELQVIAELVEVLTDPAT